MKGIQFVLYIVNLVSGMVYMIIGFLSDTPEKETHFLLMAIVLLIVAAMIRNDIERAD